MKARAYSPLLDMILTVVLIVISILTIIVCTGYVFDLNLRTCAAAAEASLSCSNFGFHSSMILTFWGGIAVVGVAGVKARLRASNSGYGWWLLLIGIAGAIGLGAIGVALVKLTM